jgi:putative flippase GtrA
MRARVPAFLTVGALGFGLQLGVLLWLSNVWHWAYPLATALAVEVAVVHNFIWHEQWTWGDRQTSLEPGLRRLVRFHLSAGLTSLAGNVVVTTIAIEALHVPILLANVCAVATMSVANFLMADRWVFSRTSGVVLAVLLLFAPMPASAAELRVDTIAAWNRHIAAVEMTLREHEADTPVATPEGRSVPVPGGTIHEWRGSVVVRGTTVARLVRALEVPGLPPPADDILDARVMRRSGDSLHVYLKLARTALITVTYDTEHDVAFAQRSPGFAVSRSVSTSIREEGGADRGFLWRLNSYWRYRQQGDDVMVDVLSVSLSREVPALVRTIAAPMIDRIARESMRRTLEAVDRFGTGLSGCEEGCGARGSPRTR